MDIKEGLVSKVSEIFKVSKKVSTPFAKYLLSLKKIKTSDNNDSYKKELEKFEKIVSSSGMPENMKDRFIRNMRQDAYDTLYNAGAFNGIKIQELYKWSDSIYHPILRNSTVT